MKKALNPPHTSAHIMPIITHWQEAVFVYLQSITFQRQIFWDKLSMPNRTVWFVSRECLAKMESENSVI